MGGFGEVCLCFSCFRSKCWKANNRGLHHFTLVGRMVFMNAKGATGAIGVKGVVYGIDYGRTD